MLNQDNILSLSLYHYQSCPFCAATRAAIISTTLDVELRNVQQQPHYRAELIKNGGKSQVPCLRIENTDGSVDWLYESADIIQLVEVLAQKEHFAA